MQHKVYILTGAVQTGKTTALQNWCVNQTHVSGIVTPIINGKRFFVNVATQETFAMEAMEEETEVVKIGRFVFSAAAFAIANSIIEKANNTYVIVDEIGPLELNGLGLYKACTQLLLNPISHIIIVVREGLVEQVIDFFNIQRPIIISTTTLEQL